MHHGVNDYRPKVPSLRRHEVTWRGLSERGILARGITFQTLGLIDASVIRERFKAVGQNLNERSCGRGGSTRDRAPGRGVGALFLSRVDCSVR